MKVVFSRRPTKKKEDRNRQTAPDCTRAGKKREKFYIPNVRDDTALRRQHARRQQVKIHRPTFKRRFHLTSPLHDGIRPNFLVAHFFRLKY